MRENPSLRTKGTTGALARNFPEVSSLFCNRVLPPSVRPSSSDHSPAILVLLVPLFLHDPRKNADRPSHIGVRRVQGDWGEPDDVRGAEVGDDAARPNVIRLAPAPLYTSYHDLWQIVQALREIVDTGEHLRLTRGRELVA